MRVREYELTEYALALRYEDLDPTTCRHVSDIVFDTVGIAVGAYVQGHESGKVCEEYMLERIRVRNTAGEAVLWPGRGTACADEAALCNGTWAEILDFQDVAVDARNAGHAGVTIVPAAVAAAEAAGAGGRELVVSVTAGLGR
jgi:2-methylcitrate dehydratase PrpD